MDDIQSLFNWLPTILAIMILFLAIAWFEINWIKKEFKEEIKNLEKEHKKLEKEFWDLKYKHVGRR